MKKWEYKILPSRELIENYAPFDEKLDGTMLNKDGTPKERARLTIALNNIGKEGWELTHTQETEDLRSTLNYFFKREKN